MNPMHYLFSAFAAIWVILAVYLFSMYSRERKLRDEVRHLREIIESSHRN